MLLAACFAWMLYLCSAKPLLSQIFYESWQKGHCATIDAITTPDFRYISTNYKNASDHAPVVFTKKEFLELHCHKRAGTFSVAFLKPRPLGSSEFVQLVGSDHLPNRYGNAVPCLADWGFDLLHGRLSANGRLESLEETFNASLLIENKAMCDPANSLPRPKQTDSLAQFAITFMSACVQGADYDFLKAYMTEDYIFQAGDSSVPFGAAYNATGFGAMCRSVAEDSPEVFEAESIVVDKGTNKAVVVFSGPGIMGQFSPKTKQVCTALLRQGFRVVIDLPSRLIHYAENPFDTGDWENFSKVCGGPAGATAPRRSRTQD